jgi:hypothetical protein
LTPTHTTLCWPLLVHCTQYCLCCCCDVGQLGPHSLWFGCGSTAVHLTFIHQHRLLLRHCHPSSHSCCTTGQPPRLQPTAQAGHTLRLLILLQPLQVLLLQLATCPVPAPASCCCCCCFVFCSVGHQAAANSGATCGCTQAPDADVAICTNAQQLVAHKRRTCKYTIARGDGVHSFGLV